MYFRPAQPHFQALIEKKSRFLCYLYACSSRSEMLTLIANLRVQYPDARHYCSAVIAGDPAHPNAMAYDDDGEPSGTAGKPMLNVLQHRQMGDTLAVVVRYFGGIKLGAGGLVRAYSGVTSNALTSAILEQVQPQQIAKFSVEYGLENLVRYQVEQLQGAVIEVCHQQYVVFKIKLPVAEVSVFGDWLQDVTSGQSHLQV